MCWIRTVVISFVVGAVVGRRDFPLDFKFGAATAAYQVEGAWNISDKSPSIWDSYVRRHPERILDNATGDVACNSYSQWKKDVEIASHVGLHFYRFSISWTRVMPSGFPHTVSEDGTKFYNDLIDALLEKGIEPVVTLYHWDLPQSLQDLGGWTNPLVSDWFADYARVMFSLYGDRVKTWITLNEPIIFCEIPYNTAYHAPGILSPGVGNYLCNKHAMLAHAKAWRIYDKQFRSKYNGKVSLANHILWLEPENATHVEITEIARQYMVGMHAHPIFSKKGGWPPVIEKIIADKSKKEGLSKSRLPPFTKKEINFIKGTYDFFAINYYTARVVRPAMEGEAISIWPYFGAPDLGIVLSVRPEWKAASSSLWFYIYPEGLRYQLGWLKEQYGNIDILITENGYSSTDGGLEDVDRVQYYKEHLKQVLLAIEDRVKVTGYTAWTLIDNFEWTDGYRTKFGLYQVDFEDPLRKRTPRASAEYYGSVIKNHSLDTY